MLVIAVAPLDKPLGERLAAAWCLPLAYDEVVECLARSLQLRGNLVGRLLDGSAGLVERLTVDRTGLAICSAAQVADRAARGVSAVVPAWGASRLLSGVPRVLCVRRCDALAAAQAPLRDPQDLALALRVRAALRLAGATRALQIAVSAEGPCVILEGIVECGAQRAEADAIAAGVAGVRRVENRLRAADSLRPRFA